MPEPIKVTTVQQIDALELEKLIREVYGRKFSVLAYFEASQDTVRDISVPWDDDWTWDDETSYGTKPPTLAEWSTERPPNLEHSGWEVKWRFEEAPGPHLGEIIDDLHAKGLLPAGDFQLHCWW